MTSRRQPPFGHSEFLMEVRKGTVPGHKMVEINGFSSAMGVTRQAFWGNTSDISRGLLTAPSTIICTSTDAEDTSDGDGVRTCFMAGLDANGDEESEVMIMNGLDGVISSKVYSAINELRSVEIGISKSNLGDMWAGNGIVTGGIPAEKFFWMGTGGNNGQTLSYAVPRGKTGFILESSLSIGDAVKAVMGDICVDDGEFTIILKSLAQGLGSSNLPEQASRPVLERTQYFWRGQVDVNTASVSARVEMMVIDNYQLSL